MDEQMKERIALFRYGLIAPLFNDQVEPNSYLAEMSAKQHDVPFYGIREYTPKTIKAWLLTYRRYGFDGLKPKTRSDRGKSRRLTLEQQHHVIALRKERDWMPVTMFYEYLVKEGEVMPKEVSSSTIRRFLAKQGLLGHDPAASPDRKRFAYDKVNALWQTDMSDGPWIRVGNLKVKTYLVGFIDDCSRLVPFAQFVVSEKFDSLRTVMKEALLRRGIPKMLYTDNGRVFRSDTLQFACAELGITLIHTRSFDPQAKGKIERFFRTVKTRFYTLLKEWPASSVEELNERFWQWLEEDYHRKVHASLEGKMPLEVFLEQADHIRTIDDPSKLDAVFLKRVYRKVKHDSTLSLDNRLYEVPEMYINQRVEIRYDASDVHVYQEGKAVAQAVEVKVHDNAHVKRQRSSLSFKSLQEGEDDHV